MPKKDNKPTWIDQLRGAWARYVKPCLARWRWELGLAIAGAILLLFPGWEFADWPLWQRVLLGLAGGFFLGAAVDWLREAADDLGLEDVEISIPGIEAKLKITPRQRTAAWKLFVQLATRVATQSLVERDKETTRNSGKLSVAIASLHGLFGTCREELQASKPSSLLERKLSEETFESYVLRILNQGLRPFLARWHPLVEAWEKTGLPEEDWPLAELCHRDLEATRKNLMHYMQGLAEIAGVPTARAESLLSLREDAQVAPPPEQLLSVKELKEKLDSAQYLPNEAEQAYRKLYLAVGMKLPAEPALAEPSELAKAVASMGELATELETKLGEVPRLPQKLKETPHDRALAVVLLSSVQPLLAKWGELSKSWIEPAPVPPDDSGAQAPPPDPALLDSCRNDLKKSRAAVAQALTNLGDKLRLTAAKS